jgi:hypothetical protein
MEQHPWMNLTRTARKDHTYMRYIREVHAVHGEADSEAKHRVDNLLVAVPFAQAGRKAR